MARRSMTLRLESALETGLKTLRSGKKADGKNLTKKGAKTLAGRLFAAEMISAAEAAKHGVAKAKAPAAKKPAKKAAKKAASKKPAKAAAPAKKPVKKHVKVTKEQHDAAVKHVLTHLHTIARYHGATHKEAKFFTNLVHKYFQDLLKDLAVLVTSRRTAHANRLRAHAKKAGGAAVAAGVKAAKKAVAAGATPAQAVQAAEKAVEKVAEAHERKYKTLHEIRSEMMAKRAAPTTRRAQNWGWV